MRKQEADQPRFNDRFGDILIELFLLSIAGLMTEPTVDVTKSFAMQKVDEIDANPIGSRSSCRLETNSSKLRDEF